MNLYGSYDVTQGFVVTAGLNNFFDKDYRDHTNGINRAAGSDVAVGERLPGAGQSVFMRLNFSW
jgi:iron complex outermembrane receptor protein